MMTNIAIAFGADPATAETDAGELMDFEIELANVIIFAIFQI